MQIALEIDNSTQFATAYHDGKPVATVQRRRVYEKGPAWKVYGLDGKLLFELRLDGYSAKSIARNIGTHLTSHIRNAVQS